MQIEYSFVISFETRRVVSALFETTRGCQKLVCMQQKKASSERRSFKILFCNSAD